MAVGEVGDPCKDDGSLTSVAEAEDSETSWIVPFRNEPARQTGCIVSIYRALDENPYAVVCEDHSFVMGIDTLHLARSHASAPLGWCEYCNGAADDTPDWITA